MKGGETVEKIYKYRVIREDWKGNRGKLKVGGLYCHLGRGFPGAQRVLSVTEEDLPD